MFSTIILCMHDSSDIPGLDVFREEMSKKQITVTMGKEGEQLREDALYLTDRTETLWKISIAGGVCCGLTPGKSEYMPGAPLVLEGLEEVEPAMLELVWKREKGIPVEVMRSDHLIIRESLEEDWDTLAGVYRDSGMNPGVEDPDAKEDPETEEKDKFMAYIRTMYWFYGYGLWTVLDKETGKVIGSCGPFPSQTIVDEAGSLQMEMGYMVDRAWRGRGYGREMAEAVLEFCFHAIGLDRIYARVHRDNKASRAVVKGLGFSLVREEAEDGLQIWEKTKSNMEKCTKKENENCE